MEKQDTHGIRVFVYGTLKKNLYNNYLITQNKHSELLGRCAIDGRFKMADFKHHPGLQQFFDKSAPKTKVYGEVWRIDDETLLTLDILEGNGHFFTRSKVPTPWKNAWCYFIPPDYVAPSYIEEPLFWKPTKEELAFFNISPDEKAQSTPLIVTAASSKSA